MLQNTLRPVRYLAPLGGALMAGALGIAAYTAHSLNRPRRRTWLDDFSFSPWEVQVPFEPVSFQTNDGVTLRGWWFPQAGSRRVIIGCNGHRSTKTDLLGIGAGLWRAGNNVLLFDFRGCGDSDLAPLSLAHNEVRDAQAAVCFARRRVDGPEIGLIGYSMGGAVAILVAAADPSVRAVVADSPFATMRDVIAHAYRRWRLPSPPILALSDALNRWRYGYGFSAVRPLDAVAQLAPRPLLLIHGSNDGLIPLDHAERLYAAAGDPKELWIAAGVQHCGAYFADRPAYVARVAAFFERALDA